VHRCHRTCLQESLTICNDGRVDCRRRFASGEACCDPSLQSTDSNALPIRRDQRTHVWSSSYNACEHSTRSRAFDSRFAKMAMNYVTFNQDYSHLAVGRSKPTLRKASADEVTGTTRGFRIFTTDPFEKRFESKEGNIAILEMLFSTSLVSLILSPRLLRMTNTKVSCKTPP
jgi:hypothetical protein